MQGGKESFERTIKQNAPLKRKYRVDIFAEDMYISIKLQRKRMRKIAQVAEKISHLPLSPIHHYSSHFHIYWKMPSYDSMHPL